ncbi:MAG: DUF2147 domain-containing protein [Deltaproteobacteria bacterium]|nr:DUF2147 domain-containing protein [Deltaproteobacteria bacterium]MBW2181629.1 DUF2147 domain-containing protein [Deltaproteobacteria bacterium]
MKRVILIMTCLVFGILSNTWADSGDTILGEWYTEGNKSAVKIYKSDSLYYGKIIWLKEPKNKEGKDKVDTKNPDESLRTRKIIGLNLVWGFQYKNRNKWANGKIYDPRSGKTYSCEMKLEGDKLNVRGYLGFSFLGKTTVWTKKD